MVFGTLKTLLGNDVEKLQELCSEGVHALELGYFPAVRDSDANRNKGLNWNFGYGFWVLMDEENRSNNYETEAASIHTVVLIELEKWKICHTSQYEQEVFPWIKPVLEKIADKKLKREEKVLVLAFVSAVALLMNGRYIDYQNLSRLERKLPLTQVMLRLLEVQCKFQLGNIHTLRLWKLHPSIPYKLCGKKTASLAQRSTEKQQVHVEHIRDDNELAGMATADESESSDQVEIVGSRHLLTSLQGLVWSLGEVQILKEVDKECAGTREEKYRLYQEKCRLKGLADRTYRAFCKKVARILPRKRKATD